MEVIQRYSKALFYIIIELTLVSDKILALSFCLVTRAGYSENNPSIIA